MCTAQKRRKGGGTKAKGLNESDKELLQTNKEDRARMDEEIQELRQRTVRDVVVDEFRIGDALHLRLYFDSTLFDCHSTLNDSRIAVERPQIEVQSSLYHRNSAAFFAIN